MSKAIATGAILGSQYYVKQAEALVEKAISEKGADFAFEFPDTGYFLPQMFAMTGFEVRTLGDMKTALEQHVKPLVTDAPTEALFIPYLGEALDAGMAALFAQEIIMAIRYIYGQEPVKDDSIGLTYHGFISDTILRNLGIQLVDGSMPGYVCIIGAANDDDHALEIARELQQKNILTLMCGNVNGDSMTKQLLRKGVQLGWDTRLVPLGPEVEHAIYALNWAARAGITFGGMKGGDFKKILKYSKDKVFAFAMVLGPLNDRIWTTGAGAINMGFPAIANTDIPVIHPTGVTIYEEVEKELDPKKIVERCIEVRGLKITVSKPPIPVAFGPAFEGERIRKEDMHIEFGGQRTPAFEWLRTAALDKVEDGKVEIVGNDPEGRYQKGGQMPLGILVEVAGRKMQKDFEPVLERKIHHFVNEAQGIWHMGQRDQNWLRVSINALKDGFQLRHFGDILSTQLKHKFANIVDKVQVTFYVDEGDVKKVLDEARHAYTERDVRLATMTDESVDTFYSCILCQSFAPNHVCVVSPERLGLCGAYNWLDAKAAFEIDPNGANQPVIKGETLDAVKGRWKGVDDYVYKNSHQALETFNAYTIMDNPMTSCGCFECIVAIVPEANGVMIVNRGYTGMTPIGMKFSTLAGTVGGGAQTPGFMGIGRFFLTSKKFLSADGGFKRIVWMTKNLKESFAEHFKKRAEEEGMPDLLDRIADESVAEDSEKLMEFLGAKEHPALTMDPMF
ncbi:MAG: CO dehydrogenase/CO-methylating acetyl-CoA synthase complex subunit beta [Nitrospirae bacterium GWC2_57_13]|nr:MAG: CO dehydrogenase/CO-methylating acetyl-CoA synthase complex subunit beta [Nitrospirae bacterium GWC2_57_13]